MTRDLETLLLTDEHAAPLLRQTQKTLLRVMKTKDPAEALRRLRSCKELNLDRDPWQSTGPAMCLDFLTALPELESLSAKYQRVASFSPIYTLRSLRTLNLESVQTDGEPFELQKLAAAQNPHFERLILNDCPWSAASEGMWPQSLKTLGLSKSRLKSLEFLPNLEKLRELDVSENDLTSLSALKTCTELRILRCGKNLVDSLEALAGLRKLTHLSVDDNAIDSVEPLRHLRELRYLNMARNRVRDIRALRDLDLLEELNLSHNPVLESDIEDELRRSVRLVST